MRIAFALLCIALLGVAPADGPRPPSTAVEKTDGPEPAKSEKIVYRTWRGPNGIWHQQDIESGWTFVIRTGSRSVGSMWIPPSEKNRQIFR